MPPAPKNANVRVITKPLLDSSEEFKCTLMTYDDASNQNLAPMDLDQVVGLEFMEAMFQTVATQLPEGTLKSSQEFLFNGHGMVF